jgi:hypothetical protein
MAEEMGFRVIDATLSIEEQQKQMRQIVEEVLGEHLQAGVLRTAIGEQNVASTTAVLQ